MISNYRQYLTYVERCFTRVEKNRVYNLKYTIHILNAEARYGYVIIMAQLCHTTSTILDQYFPISYLGSTIRLNLELVSFVASKE